MDASPQAREEEQPGWIKRISGTEGTKVTLEASSLVLMMGSVLTCSVCSSETKMEMRQFKGSSASLKRETPFSSNPTAQEKHRKQDDGHFVCLNQFHDHPKHEEHRHHASASSSTPAQSKPVTASVAPWAHIALAPAPMTAPIPEPTLTPQPIAVPAAKPAPYVPGPPPPHYPHWSRHYHNVMPKVLPSSSSFSHYVKHLTCGDAELGVEG